MIIDVLYSSLDDLVQLKDSNPRWKAFESIANYLAISLQYIDAN